MDPVTAKLRAEAVLKDMVVAQEGDRDHLAEILGAEILRAYMEGLTAAQRYIRESIGIID